MNSTLMFIWKEFKEKRWQLIIFLIILSVTAIAVVLGYDYIKKILGDVMTEESFMVRDVSLFENPQIYLWSQWSAKSLYQFGTVIALILGVFGIAGEIKDGTINFLLTKPLSRKSIFFYKAVSGLLQLLTVILLPTLILAGTAWLSFPEVNIWSIFGQAGITFSGLMVIYFFALLLSTVIADPVKAGLSAAALVLVYSVTGWFTESGFFALFGYMQGTDYYFTGSFPVPGFIIVLLVSVIFFVSGMIIFNKKEFMEG